MSTPAQACQSIEHSPSRFSPHPSRPCSTFLQNISAHRCADGTCVSANRSRGARDKSIC